MRLRTGLRLAWLAAAAALAAGSAMADFKRDYGNGVRAYNDGDFAEAVQDLTQAIEENAQAQAKVKLYGMRFEPYLPHFYLGLAKYRQGDCEGAVASFEESLRQGVIREQAQFPELQAGLADCQSRMVDVSAIAQAAEEAIGRAAEAADRFASLGSESLLRGEWGEQWQPRLEQARQTIAEMRSGLETAVAAKEASRIESITRQAGNVAAAVSGDRDLALARMDAIEQDRAERLVADRERASQELRQAIAAARALPTSDSGSSEMQNLKRELESQIARTESLSSTASALNQREVAQGIDNIVRRYQQAEQDWRAQQQAIADRKPTPVLRSIAEAYFAGDYQAAIDRSNPDAMEKSREKLQAHLFRAAASYKLYMLSGQQQAERLEQARADIRAIKRINSRFSPYIAAFSPAFIDLFRNTA